MDVSVRVFGVLPTYQHNFQNYSVSFYANKTFAGPVNGVWSRMGQNTHHYFTRKCLIGSEDTSLCSKGLPGSWFQDF